MSIAVSLNTGSQKYYERQWSKVSKSGAKVFCLQPSEKKYKNGCTVSGKQCWVFNQEIKTTMSKAKTMAEREPPINGKSVATSAGDDDRFLNLSEVARACSKSHTTIRRWIQDGLLTAVRMPSGLYAVRRSEVNKFLGASALNVHID
jgi:excisionase family DNA binding protein